MLRDDLFRLTWCQHLTLSDGRVKAYFFGPYISLGPLFYDNEDIFLHAITPVKDDLMNDLNQSPWALAVPKDIDKRLNNKEGKDEK